MPLPKPKELESFAYTPKDFTASVLRRRASAGKPGLQTGRAVEYYLSQNLVAVVD